MGVSEILKYKTVNEKITSYKDLEVWKKGIENVTEIYRISDKFPDHEIYALTSQIRRSSVSVPSNIAEGWGRRKTKPFIQFLSIASGSLYELETQLIIGNNLSYIDNDTLTQCSLRIEIIGKMINSLISKLEKHIEK